MKIQVNLGTIQETLLIPIWARAEELKQSESIIIEPKSAQIVKAIAYDFDKFSYGRNSLVGYCIREIIIENWVSSYLKQYYQDNFVKIVAGLNNCFKGFYQVKARWFDLDLLDVIQFRQQFFTQNTHPQFIVISLLDNHCVERIKQTSIPPYMFLREAVMMYFSKQQVRELFDKLIKNFFDSYFGFDSISPLMVKNQQRQGFPSKFFQEEKTLKSAVMIQSSICQQILTGACQIFARFRIGTPVIG